MILDVDNKVYHSADLEVSPQSGQVIIRGEVIRLGLINMQVLVILMEQPGQVISRAEIFDGVWKNQTVSDDVLTRCISELRNQLGKVSREHVLIETLPKRGYRWVPDVSQNPDEKNSGLNRREKSGGRDWKRALIMATSSLVLLLLLSIGILWWIEYSFKNEWVKVALIPVHSDQAEQVPMAADLDDLLQKQLLATDQVRFFSRNAMGDSARSDLLQFSRIYSARWIIEGRIREKGDVFHVSLSLVDARTALVVHTLSQDLKYRPIELKHFCSKFLDEISGLLNTDAH